MTRYLTAISQTFGKSFGSLNVVLDENEQGGKATL